MLPNVKVKCRSQTFSIGSLVYGAVAFWPLKVLKADAADGALGLRALPIKIRLFGHFLCDLYRTKIINLLRFTFSSQHDWLNHRGIDISSTEAKLFSRLTKVSFWIQVYHTFWHLNIDELTHTYNFTFLFMLISIHVHFHHTPAVFFLCYTHLLYNALFKY